MKKFAIENEYEFFIGLYDIYSDISAAFVAYRIQRKLSQAQLAEYLGVSQPMVSKYESGNYNFSIEALYTSLKKIGYEMKIPLPNPIFNSNQKNLALSWYIAKSINEKTETEPKKWHEILGEPYNYIPNGKEQYDYAQPRAS